MDTVSLTLLSLPPTNTETTTTTPKGREKRPSLGSGGSSTVAFTRYVEKEKGERAEGGGPLNDLLPRPPKESGVLGVLVAWSGRGVNVHHICRGLYNV